MTYAPVHTRPALGSTPVSVPPPVQGKAQPPIYPLVVGNNGAYKAVRSSSAQGSCGTKPYPCQHPGTDVNGVRGTPVRAPESGVVVAASAGSSSPFGGYGPWVIVIKGDGGKYHLLGHLDPINLMMAPVGRRVVAGDQVGTTSSANHTHWEVRKKLTPDFARGETNFDNNEDPVLWLKLSGFGGYLVIGSVALLALALWRRHG
jgi:murein DD-endopeptidase MepM/ murein hydrolase activator NlpD